MAERQNVEAMLLKRERERQQALVADDMDCLASILADALIHVHTTGIVHSKAQLIDHAGQFLRFYAIERGDLAIRLIGDAAAVMTGTMTNTVGRRDCDERVRVSAFVTQIWELLYGDWQLVGFHATRTPALTELRGRL